ncbi:MAG: hypothetical protein H7282_08045 [Cytophagaceae bacterium]|nr:hypothetical protein [Cytophagaceae bacterium]
MSFLILAGLAVLMSCKKSNEDPSPGGQDFAEYRLTNSLEHGPKDSIAYTYVYNPNGSLHTITINDSVNTNDRTVVLKYAANGYVNYYSETSGKPYDYSYTYDYNADGLVQTERRYLDPEGANSLDNTTTYYYNINKDLLYTIGIRNGSRDSVAFGGYVNNRPATKRSFYKSGADYELQQKCRYTYDARMNKLKSEVTNYGGDTTVFYVQEQHEFTVLDARHQLIQEAAKRNDFLYLYNDNPSLISKDQDKDAIVKNMYGNPCGIFSSFTSANVSENESGYALTESIKIENFNCGSLTKSRTNSLVNVYEKL